MSKVSIVIPCYNNEKIIVATLGKISEFIPETTEIVVIDDGSTDSTPELLDSFYMKCKTPNKIISITHSGPAKARNIGWRSASGDIILFLDADCIPTKDWYSEMIKLFVSQDVVAVQGAYINLHPENIIASYEQLQIDVRQDNFSKKIKTTDNFATYSVAIRRKYLEEVGGFDEEFETCSAEDTLLSRQLNKIGTIMHNPNALVYHEHKSSLLTYLTTQFKHSQNRILMYKKLKYTQIVDKYSGKRIMLQPVLALLSLLTILSPYFIVFFIMLCFAQVPELRKIKKLRLVTFVINILRSYVWCTGLVYGTIKFILLKRGIK